MKKVGRSLFGRNKKKSKKVAEEPTAATGESSTEATPPVLETVPVTVPVTAPPAVESTSALEPVTDGKKKMMFCCVRSKNSPFLVLFYQER